jgi:hypothetical protein
MKAQVFTLLFAAVAILTSCHGTKSKGTSAAVKVERSKPPVSVTRSSEKKNAKPSPITTVPETRVEKTTERTVETTTVVAGDDEIKGGKRN